MSLEILFNYEKNNVRCKADAVVCSIHACFIANGYKCIGKGEEFPTQDIRPSDMLPSGWSENRDCYALMYQIKAEKFLLKILNVDQILLVHLLRDVDKGIFDLELIPSDYITDNLTTFESAFRNPDRLRSLVESDLILSQSQSSVKNPRKAELESPRRNAPPHAGPFGGFGPERGTDPFMIGRNDLDPFAAESGSGMMFDPLHSGYDPARPHMPNFPDRGPAGGLSDPTRIPRGSVPFGARFDPIGPSFDPTRTMDPDPDELRPPDFDNMFM